MAKETIITMKGELILWENIFANHTSDNGLISKIYKVVTGPNTRKINNPILKMGEGPRRAYGWPIHI